MTGTTTQPAPAMPEIEPPTRLTVADRIARGRSARAAVRRSAQAVFTPSADRFDPIALLQAQDASRVPELVPIRYGRMAISPFTFFRGAAADRTDCGLPVRVVEPAVPSGDLDAGREPLHVPFPRAGHRLVEVVQVEHQTPLR